jgi:CBS domain-containing membrane protein
LKRLLDFLAPPQGVTSHAEKFLSALGGLCGIFTAAWISFHYLGALPATLMVASMGASAVLLFAVPHSPLAQPWAFVGSHLVTAVIGVSVAKLIPDTALAAALAVSLAIFAMSYLRCVHPPGGATALTAVIAGPATQALGYQFVLTPVMLNVAAMLAVALLFNNLIPGRWYPLNLQKLWEPPAEPAAIAPAAHVITRENIEAALKAMNAYIDVDESDLEKIFDLAALHAHFERIEGIPCSAVMMPGMAGIHPDTGLPEVWDALVRDDAKGIAVTEGDRQVIGIITVSDFIKQTAGREHGLLYHRLVESLHASDGDATPRTARDIMSSPVHSVSADTPIIDLLPLFARYRIHHIPVLDTDLRLIGMVTLPHLMAEIHGGDGDSV